MGCSGSKDDTKGPTQKQQQADQQKGLIISELDPVVPNLDDINQTYEFMGVIGKGGFGEVRKAKNKVSGHMRAIKILKKSKFSEEKKKALLDEAKILRALDHPNIMKLYEVYEDSNCYYLVTEYLGGGDMISRVSTQQALTEIQIAKLIRGLLNAVNYCHNRKIVHRDLKLENMLFETPQSDEAKIIDFGTATNFNSTEKLQNQVGTVLYTAPEVFVGNYNEKCDIWGIGVILYTLVVGSSPFQGNSEREIKERICSGNYRKKSNALLAISEEGRNLIFSMLENEPAKRLSASQAINHKWFDILGKDAQAANPVSEEALQQLKRLKSESELKSILWSFSVTYLLSNEEKSRLTEVFKQFDIDSSGQISKEELFQAFKNSSSLTNIDNEELNKIIENADTSKNGKITYAEFLAASIEKDKYLTEKRIDEAFRLIDRTHDGKISLEDLKSILSQSKAQKLSEETWSQWIAQVDVDKDGMLSLEEFKNLMLSKL